MDTLQSARDWTDKGYSVIPIGWRSKRPAFDALRMTNSVVDEHLSWEEYKTRPPTPAELRLWFTGPRRNLGIVTGWQGLVVLDFDDKELYEAWLKWAADMPSARVSASTFRVFSARGVHVYLLVDEPVESYHLPGIDVKGKWGYVLVPPSVHPNGTQYTAASGAIAHCATLAEVFPFERPSYTPTLAAPMDPWEAASRATDSIDHGAVADIRHRVSLQQLLGVEVGNRRFVRAQCPLHDDQNPSLLVYADNHCQCLAGCNGGKQMDVIDVYAALHHLSTRQAIAELATKCR